MDNSALGKLNGSLPLYQAIEQKIDKSQKEVFDKIDSQDGKINLLNTEILKLVTSIDAAVATLKILIPFGFAFLIILAGLVGIKLTGIHF